MSARPTVADVLAIIRNDPAMHDAAKAAAVLAHDDWHPDGEQNGYGEAPNGWIGGRVRDTLPEWLDAALGAWGDDGVEGDPTGEIGAAFYPEPVADVANRAALDALPVGALLLDRDRYVLVKCEFIAREPDGTARHGVEYAVLHNPDTPGEYLAVFGEDEIAGDYAEPGTGSSFLPGRAYVIRGKR